MRYTGVVSCRGPRFNSSTLRKKGTGQPPNSWDF